MERRHFLKLAFGFIAGASALAAGAVATEAAPLPPVTPEGQGPVPPREAEPAIATQDDVDRLAPDQVRWRRHWGWRRRHWRRRRYWGYRRRWHRRWRRRYWRRRYWW
jgi:hypothetical protein